MKVSDIKAISMAEAKEILEQREKFGELGYEQKIAVEHLKKHTRLSGSDAKKMIDEISAVLRMSNETLAMIVNILPKNPDEVRMIFARERFSLKEEEISKIIEIVKKYA
ncbi:MAG: RNA polymerase Rpb4 family protein [Nanoarchaeota archaeon]|nr:RNA polymerase Rpb4 family protein [Nanoarchaeota archaeon]